MFSGLVESKTRVVQLLSEQGGGILLTLERPTEFSDLAIGDSIATQGCCLTIIDLGTSHMAFQAGEETLSKTTLGSLRVGNEVNCERALALGERVGGHLVTGHVDGRGRLRSRSDHADWSDMVFEAEPQQICQMASKGSIAVDGVSLTLVEVTRETFSIALIPHTLKHTTLGTLVEGDAVNLETDLLAKYVQQQLSTMNS